MKPDKRLSVAKPSEPHGFYELAKAHVEAHGGAWFVADKRRTPQQWRAWIAYFAWLDGQTIPRSRKATAFGALEKLTVPTEWPLWFDASAPPSPLPDQREEMPSPERRKQLVGLLIEAIAGLAMPHQPRAKPFMLPVAEAKPLFVDKPLVATPAMAAYLEGMRAPAAEVAF